ncbi:MAG: DUF3488 domain-containing protein [Phycisphaerae bacterium]|nr:DUF3488 domain-containing protein [Phycisphaerae bacterium]
MPLSSYTTADMVLTERRRLEQPLLLLIWLGTTTFSLAEGNLLYLISCTLGVGINWLVVRRNMEIYIRRAFVNIGVVLSLIVIVLEAQFANVLPQVTVGHFMMLIQLLKLFERKRARDYIQLLTLNMLLMVTTALICSAPWFAVALVMYLLLASYVAMVFTLKRGLDAAGATRLRGEAGPLSPRQVAWNVIRQWPGKSLHRFIWAVTIPALIVGVFAFLLTPRTGGNILEEAQKNILATGFDTSIRLGQQKTIYLSDRIVLRVAVHRDGWKSSQAAEPPSRYLRGVVMDSYENSSWKNTAGNERYLLSAAQPAPLDTGLGRGLVRHDIRSMTLGHTDLFAPYPTVRMNMSEGINVMFSRGLEYAVRGAYPPRERLRYETISFPPPLDERRRAHLAWIRGDTGLLTQPRVQLPPIAKKRVTALAEEWCGDLLEQLRDPPHRTDELSLQIAQRIETQLKKNYEYTLDLSQSDPSRDGVEDFLFHLRRGHCEYFASAMTVMCNLLGVPARVAVGFVMDEYDPDTDEFIVRDRDAHAWCEVFTEATDWTPFDPTPGGARLEAMERPWYAFIKDFFQEIHFQWYQQVVGYDLAEQRELSDRATDEALALWRQCMKGLHTLKDSFLNLLQRGVVDRLLFNFLLVLQGFTALIVLVIVVQHIRRRRRRKLPVMGRRLVLLNRLLALLERRGLIVTPDKTLLEQMSEARKKFNLPAFRLDALAHLQYRWRWGRREPTPEELQQAREHFDALCEQISAQGKTGRERESLGDR